MKRRLLLTVSLLILASLACQIDLTPTPPPQPIIPTAAATITLTPAPTLTPTPTITPTPPLTASTGPALLSIHMFTELRGWGLTEDMLLSTGDGGLSWAQVSLPGAQVDASIGAHFFSADIAHLVVPAVGGQLGQLYVTSDGGQTWQITPVPFPRAEFYYVDSGLGFALQTLSQTENSMEVSIYLTTDGGIAWRQVYPRQVGQPGSNLPNGFKTGLSFINPSTGWMGLASLQNAIGFYSTGNSGQSWTKQELTVPEDLDTYRSTVWPAVVFPGKSVDGFLPVDFVSLETGVSTRVFYVTHDIGATWTAGPAIPEGAAYEFINPQTGWAWGGHTIYFTGDGGETWSQFPVAFGRTERATCINFIDLDNGWIITVDAKNHVRLYRTADGGSTWTAMIP